MRNIDEMIIIHVQYTKGTKEIQHSPDRFQHNLPDGKTDFRMF